MDIHKLEQFDRIEDVIETIARKYSNLIALQIWEGGRYHSITYEKLDDAMCAGAARLQEIGVKSGDRIILLGESRRIEWVIAFLAIVKAKATAVILDSSIAITDFQRLIPYCDASAILTTHYFNDLINEHISIPVLDYQHSLQILSKNVTSVPENIPHIQDGDSAIGGILFTSGTTFQPKGVMLTHQNSLHVAIQCIVFSGSKKGEQILGVLPLHHSFGLHAMLMSLFVGGTLTFVDKLEGEAILSAMQHSQTSLLIGTPRLLEAFYKNILQAIKSKGFLAQALFSLLCAICNVARVLGVEHLGLHLFKSVHAKFGGHLTKIISGASPLPLQITQKLEQLGWTVMEGYGLTETGGAISCNKVNKRRAGTVGFPIQKSEIKISYPNVHGEGEICFKGPNLMLGYFRDPQSTQHCIRDGWLHTGDLGFIDRKGYLTVTGRIKELIVASSGKKIMPDDVEQRYYGIPGIQELAVVPIRPSEQPYDEVHAAIVLDPKIYPTYTNEVNNKIKQLLSSRARSIPNYLRIQQFHIVNELPKTTTLKVRRSVLKKLLETQKSSNMDVVNEEVQAQLSSVDPDTMSKKLIEILINQSDSFKKSQKILHLYHSLQFDLGIDSLNRIETAANLKKEFNIEFDEQLFFNIDKVEDVIQLVKSSLQMKHPIPSSTKKTSKIPPLMPRANKLFFGLFTFASRIVWQFETEGLHLIPAHIPFILCPNHVTNLDLLFVASCLEEQARINLCCFAKEEIFANAFFRQLAHVCHAIPIDRLGDVLPALEAGKEVLQKGRNLLINPEGTRSQDGTLGSFRKGAAYLSLQTGYPLIPVKIIGGMEIFPPHLKLPRFFNWRQFRRYKIKIIFGEPITMHSHAEEDEESLTERLRDEVEKLGQVSILPTS